MTYPARTPMWTFWLRTFFNFLMILIFRVCGVVFLCDPRLDRLAGLLQTWCDIFVVTGLFTAAAVVCLLLWPGRAADLWALRSSFYLDFVF